MSDPFDFEAFIAGLSDALPRSEVPLVRVLHQSRIDELNEQIKKSSEQGQDVDERESSLGVDGLISERDALQKAQDESATWFELRALGAQEFSDIANDPTKDVVDQIVAQSEGTRSEASRETWDAIRQKSLPGPWMLFVARANAVIAGTLVMPDFSQSVSETLSPPAPSAN